VVLLEVFEDIITGFKLAGGKNCTAFQSLLRNVRQNLVPLLIVGFDESVRLPATPEISEQGFN
jgi:hypothetical protein